MTSQKRRDILVRIISREDMKTQEQLRVALRDYGFNVSQVTVSRDLEALHVKRRLNSKGMMVYSLPEREERGLLSEKAEEKQQRDQRPPVTGIVFQGCNCIIKTRKGYAQAVAVSIDEINSPLVLGTIAGLDTVLLITADKLHNETIRALIEKHFHIEK